MGDIEIEQRETENDGARKTENNPIYLLRACYISIHTYDAYSSNNTCSCHCLKSNCRVNYKMAAHDMKR